MRMSAKLSAYFAKIIYQEGARIISKLQQQIFATVEALALAHP